MLLKAVWIEEAEGEFCPICRETKKGRFLVIYLDGAGVNRYLAVCESCLKR